MLGRGGEGEGTNVVSERLPELLEERGHLDAEPVVGALFHPQLELHLSGHGGSSDGAKASVVEDQVWTGKFSENAGARVW